MADLLDTNFLDLLSELTARTVAEKPFTDLDINSMQTIGSSLQQKSSVNTSHMFTKCDHFLT
jgi:hypothetical protein